MKLVTYRVKERSLTIQGTFAADARMGWLNGEYVVDAGFAQEWAALEKGLPFRKVIPTDLLKLLDMGNEGMDLLRQIERATRGTNPAALTVEGEPVALRREEVKLLAPLPVPRSFRDFYAFEQHVKTSRARRGLDMVPEWYEIPVFYFSNHHAFVGPDTDVIRPAYTTALDYELEIACVIGKPGIHIPAEKALDHIAGFCVLNDWSARDVQRKEMKVGLGPAKGKDFATSMGPCLVTLDELEPYRKGDRWHLPMKASINGKLLSTGNAGDLYYSFGEMIARASESCRLLPGDVIGSGTVGTGCLLELGTEVHPWLQPGDVVELEVEGLGVLRNRIA
ncbi:fumarylacetoacetase [Marinithermofilum abyssi]|uniref:Fumarylacetoacetase n=1 Tax=Marinithermofilum abyssi TaxID=1571185 RepID=A0A8J2YAV3_9BACL|nr:fumarylacetoacetase [Marinithermofilum abyssi]